MAITKDHELHKRRLGRNMGLGLSLLAFVVLVFMLTVSKVKRGESIEAYDYEPRISLTPKPEAGE